jgi:hypothetical protein
MKNLLLALTMLFAAAGAQAANGIQNYENAVGSEIIVRQVLDKKLLKGEWKDFNKDLVRAIEGSGESKIRNTLTKFTCDAGLGSDYCEIIVTGETEQGATGSDQGADYSFTLNVRIFHGTVLSAHITNQAG